MPSVSFVIPAHNEGLLFGRTLAAIEPAARTVGDPVEVIVVDDASTDCTAAIARAGVAAENAARSRNREARCARQGAIAALTRRMRTAAAPARPAAALTRRVKRSVRHPPSRARNTPG
jgi:glycosyltransferase involved in cell wall biosynthesis